MPWTPAAICPLPSRTNLDYIVTTTLTVRTNGDGSINPAYNGVILPIGTNYP